jgi:LmbE family N-acetylglucosaminyl deacetylase
MLSLNRFKRALVLAPHTDDGEFGCGGAIARLVEEGCEVHYAAFSACQQSVRADFPPDILVTEVKAATVKLGVKPTNLELFDFEVRRFNYERQKILDTILGLKSRISPDLVIMPCVHDIHQDHSTISNEALRAFKFATVLCYELPWNNFQFSSDCFIELQPRHLETKMKAVAEYRSQAHRPYANESFLRSLAVMRGIQCDRAFAEAFELKRIIF